jgi:hypothetical protein
MSFNYNSVIANCLRKKDNSRSILYIKRFQEMTNSINAALFMSQLLFWWGKGAKKGWIYKTINEIREETGLTKDQQRTAIRIWVEADILETKLWGVPPKRHFRINVDSLLEFLDIRDSLDEELQK